MSKGQSKAKSPALLSVGQVSKRLAIPSPTIRFWEHELPGIISPRRTAGGQRRYDPAQVELLARIKDLRSTGLGLGEIKGLLARPNDWNPEEADKFDRLSQRIAGAIRQEIELFLRDQHSPQEFPEPADNQRQRRAR